MKHSRKHQPTRSADSDRITFSLPKSLKEKIEEAAKKENRKTSNWLTVQLQKLFGE